VTPSLAGGYLFAPTAATVVISGADVTQDFTDSGAYGISGTITGAASSGLTVTLSGSMSATATTDALGNYSFTGLPNGSYTVTPSGASYNFTPASASVTIANSSAVQNFSSTIACSWQQTAAYPLSSTPAGAVIRNGALGTQGPSTVYGRTAWYQTSDWNLLFVPTGLTASDDVFAVEADLYLPSPSGLDRTANIEVFTTTATLPGPNGTCQASGGVAALLGGDVPQFSWNSTATCAWTQLDSVSFSPPTNQWQRLRIEGVRSSCALRALLDGALIRTWDGSCTLDGTYFVLSSNSASGGSSLAAWSNLTVLKGNSPTCVP
jgi:hypothetical protein